MRPLLLRLLVLVLLGSLFLSSMGLAAAPPAKEGIDTETTQPAANLATAAKAVMNPAGTVEALNQKIRASEEQNQAAVAALAQAQAENKPAQSAPAAKAGGGKVIYGDIIIHK